MPRSVDDWSPNLCLLSLFVLSHAFIDTYTQHATIKSKLYALDSLLDLDCPTKAKLEKAMEGHVLAKAEYVGTYAKSA